MLPIGQAIKLPFDFKFKIRFEALSGVVEIKSNKLYRGMIKIGGRGSDMFGRTTTVLNIKGSWILEDQIEIGHGALIDVRENGNLVFGNRVRIGAKTKVFCVKNISIGNEVDVSWECQIFDTNFHDIVDTVSGFVEEKNGDISIGNNVWIGNRVTISKSSFIPDDIIVASNSLCNKNYSNVKPYTILAGLPVSVVRYNKKRIFE
jgi:acetyltransferase-like isoleucine patch superfamily enzyme